MTQESKHSVGLIESLVILVVMLAILGILIIKFQVTPHVPILIVFTLLLFYGKFRGFSWDEIHNGIMEGIKPGIIPIIIFLLIGVLVATWISAGTIPTIMYFGFKIVSVKFFIPTVFLLCAIVGVTVGSAFTTISTMGIAFLGISHILGFSNALTAGAIVSGAFLGNNLSPLSDTTNLASGLVGVDLYRHIKSMAKTAIPSALVALVTYWIIGRNSLGANLTSIQSMSDVLSKNFDISFWAILPVIFLFVMAWFKVPAIPSLLASSFSALLITMFRNVQHLDFKEIANMLMVGFKAHTGNSQMDTLLTRGGINSMLGSAALIILALSLGGLLIKFNVVATLINSIQRFVSTPGKVILMTIISSVGVNFLVGEQYLSIILPGETFKTAFDKVKLGREYLSRTLAAGGSAVNSLVPWGVSGIFISGALNVNPLEYVKFATYSYVEPLMSIIIGFTFVTWKEYKLKQSK